MTETQQTLGQLICDARLSAKLTQAEAANLAGCWQSEWSEWECDKVEPTVASLRKIATALNREIIGLISGM